MITPTRSIPNEKEVLETLKEMKMNASAGPDFGIAKILGRKRGYDFGMARIFPSYATQEKASRLVGTYGYMAPENAFEGLLSIKSDVFSFGVLLLEIISGKRSAAFQHSGDGEFHNLLLYAWQMWKEGRWREFIDHSFGDEYKPGDMRKYLTLALRCVQVKAIDRPTMSDIAAMLSSDDITVPEPRQPAYS